MTRAALMMTMLALPALPCASHAEQRDAKSCFVEVLTSEMLSAAPPFYHTVKARLLVTSADRPAFETTVVRTIPWQAAPPRQGQRVRVACEQASALSDFHLF